jgi:hypothetical protein
LYSSLNSITDHINDDDVGDDTWHIWGRREIHTVFWWEDNIKMVLKGVGWERVDWIYVVCCCKCGNEISGSIKYGASLD